MSRPNTPEPLTTENYQPWPRRWLLILVVALICWAAVHAVGTYVGGTALFKLGPKASRGLMVLLFMALFLIWWYCLLKFRKPRRLKYRIPPPESNDSKAVSTTAANNTEES